MACLTRILVVSRTRSWPCTTRETVAVETPARRATSKRVTTSSRSAPLPPVPRINDSHNDSHKRNVNVYIGNLSAYTNPQHRTGQGPWSRGKREGEPDDGSRRRPVLPRRIRLGRGNGRLPDRGRGGHRRQG